MVMIAIVIVMVMVMIMVIVIVIVINSYSNTIWPWETALSAWITQISYLHMSLPSTLITVNKTAWEKSSRIPNSVRETDFQSLKLGD